MRNSDGLLWMVYRAKGAMVKDADINTARRGRTGVRAAPGHGRGHGGRRVKMTSDEALRTMPVHATLKDARKRIIERSVSVVVPTSPDYLDSD